MKKHFFFFLLFLPLLFISCKVKKPFIPFEYVNPTFENITGYSLNESVGKNPSVLKSDVTPDSEYRNLWKTITKTSIICVGPGRVWKGSYSLWSWRKR